VDNFKEDNEQYRYLKWEEEPLLMAQLTGRRANMKPKVIVAIGTGMRLTEQLSMRAKQVDFSRNLVTAIHTKTCRNRQIPMSPEVRDVLLSLCKGKRPDDFVFYNPKTGNRVKEIKTALEERMSRCQDRRAAMETLARHLMDLGKISASASQTFCSGTSLKP
jgi:integrase